MQNCLPVCRGKVCNHSFPAVSSCYESNKLLGMAIQGLVLLLVTAGFVGVSGDFEIKASASWKNDDQSCPTELLAQYQVVLKTFWSKKDFPKHYPEWRPHAQWTKLLGVTHHSDFVLFREGQRSSDALKIFVETGKSDQLDSITYASQGSQVLDVFYAPAIQEGVGTTQAKFFVDGAHSKLSMVAKIVPSPDWFIGVDALQLCSGGHWLNASSIQLSPLDAGTDQGLAFTSPSWELVPPDPISRITHTSPSHPASSFAYPNKTALPVLASVSIAKIREYKLVKPSSSPRLPLKTVEITTPRPNPVTRRVIGPVSPSYPRPKIYHQNVHSGQTLPELSTKLPIMHADEGQHLAPSSTRVPPSTSTTTNSPPDVLDESHLNEISLPEPDKSSQPNHGNSLDAILNNEIISNDVISTARPFDLNLAHNKVLTREQYDREEKKRALESHREKLKKIIEEKEKKLQINIRKPLQETKSIHINVDEPGLKPILKPGRRRRPTLTKPGQAYIPEGDAMAVIDSIVESYQRDQRKLRRKQRRRARRRRRQRNRLNGEMPRRSKHAVDCKVSEWSKWSSCSKTCDIGEQQRKREILQHSRRGGRKCPNLVETTWCGSARGCRRDYFKWSR